MEIVLAGGREREGPMRRRTVEKWLIQFAELTSVIIILKPSRGRPRPHLVLMAVDFGREGEFHLIIISTVSMMMANEPPNEHTTHPQHHARPGLFPCTSSQPAQTLSQHYLGDPLSCLFVASAAVE